MTALMLEDLKVADLFSGDLAQVATVIVPESRFALSPVTDVKPVEEYDFAELAFV